MLKRGWSLWTISQVEGKESTVFPLSFGAAFLQMLLHDGFLTGLLFAKRLDGANLPVNFTAGGLFLPVCHWAVSVRRKCISVNPQVSQLRRLKKKPEI